MAPPGAPATIAVSAPGKVLLAGGYLVLDRRHTGLVFALSARVTAVARDLATPAASELTEIVVESPQFRNATWRYGYRLVEEDGGIQVTGLEAGKTANSSPFIETALSYCLTYVARRSHLGSSQSLTPVHVTILADNDYYSAPHTLAAVSSPSGQRYARFPSTLSETHKTGLGSSAALVTALTASLLAHYLSPHGFTLASPEGRATLHNLAQAAHCAAQGKIGSGFDVAAAVYGSCRYRRFSPSILSGIGVVGSPGFAALLANLVDDKAESGGKVWDTEIDSDAVTLPKGICLRMCDVDHGTATVGMVKKVLAWREADATKEEANRLWTDLDKASIELEAVLRDAAADEAQLSRLPAALRRVRTLAKEMGRLSGADVEPDSQTALLDALTDPDSLGCYGGVCPGAGGLDAVALLARDDVETLKRLQDKLAAYAGEHGVRLRLLDVKGELEGVRAEDPAQFKGWI